MRRTVRSLDALLARGALHAPTRRLGLLVLVLLIAWALFGPHRSVPTEELTRADTEKVYAALLSHVARGGPNHLHSRRLYHYAEPFAKAAGADVHVVRAAALLHDATKEDGAGEPKERFCTHGEQGAELAKVVLTGIGKSPRFADAAAAAIREHMGPCGINWSHLSRRFMSKFCGRRYPKPESPEASVLYDVDMLDLMTVDGVVKVAELRQTNPEFEKEPLRDSVKTGPDSAWKSVVDAKQTLLTEKAKACGADLTAHTEAFIDGLDFEKVTDVTALKRAAALHLAEHPLPACLPKVPPEGGGTHP